MFFFQESAKEVLDAESPEFWCQNSLLKLQSLLSNPHLSTAPVKDTISHFLEKVQSSSVVGELSLRLLCCKSSLDAVPLLCASPHPSVLLTYAKESTKDPFRQEHWRLALHTLQERLLDDSAGDHEAWYSAQQELLEHLAHKMTLAEFVRTLPASSGADEEFQGYIQMCRKNQQAEDIQALIVSTGQKLLATLNF